MQKLKVITFEGLVNSVKESCQLIGTVNTDGPPLKTREADYECIQVGPFKSSQIKFPCFLRFTT